MSSPSNKKLTPLTIYSVQSITVLCTCRSLSREHAAQLRRAPHNDASVSGERSDSDGSGPELGNTAEGPEEGDAGEVPLTDEEFALRLQAEEDHTHMMALAGYGNGPSPN